MLRPSVLRSTGSIEELRGRFDVIGDVHGCFDELVELLGRMGYADTDGVFRHATRRAVFLGDLADRGPRSLPCVELVMRMHEAGAALSHAARVGASASQSVPTQRQPLSITQRAPSHA